jgi:hypothetical protein
MNIMNIFLTGLAWILSFALVISVLAMFLLATWMQVNDGKEQAYEAKAKAQESASTHPAAKRRRRRPAAGYSCQMP